MINRNHLDYSSNRTAFDRIPLLSLLGVIWWVFVLICGILAVKACQPAWNGTITRQDQRMLAKHGIRVNVGNGVDHG